MWPPSNPFEKMYLVIMRKQWFTDSGVSFFVFKTRIVNAETANNVLAMKIEKVLPLFRYFQRVLNFNKAIIYENT